MIIKLWDFLFTRKQWKITGYANVFENGKEYPICQIIIMQDQFGNIKKKKIKY